MKNIEEILGLVKDGKMSIEKAMENLKGYEDLGFAKVDHHRSKRKGFPEVIYAEGKTAQQVHDIFLSLREKGGRVLATRVQAEVAKKVEESVPDVIYNERARTLYWTNEPETYYPGYVAVVCAGTSDMPVGEEAVVTLEALGCRVERIYDVGVAGIHRLFDRLDQIQQADVVVVVAGMEGALASVVGGLVSKPIIAVPTSVGYGANFGGLSALLTMLNSCATGVSVVNIDNGFGAGYSAGVIVKNKYERK
ncbi:nickel pincer cofactor biosynthesis protein LarB [Ammoniphilus sp. 3BR4]|uniref:nickel pincer cofactor biosynthesis protein LarB n=1 Tax=Ammoniphilus sp. 3BR4 TaxID=3158265 RepID=UPI003467342E